MLDEHAPRTGPEDEKKPAQEAWEGTPAERKLVKRLKKKFEEAKKHKSLFDANWLTYYKMYRGRQWETMRPSYRHGEVVNFIFQNAQSMVPIMLDTRPKFEFMATEPTDREFAEIMNDLAASDWEKKGWMGVLTEVAFDGWQYGSGLSRMKYDPEAGQGLGEIDYRSADPFYCFPDPDSSKVNDEDPFVGSDYFCYAQPVSLRKLKKAFPKYAKYMKADLVDLTSDTKHDVTPLRIRSPIDNRSVVETTAETEFQLRDKALMIEMVWRCDEIEEIEVPGGVDANGAPVPPVYEQRLKYPNGRYTVIVNDIPVFDGPAPLEDGTFPWQKFDNYVLQREFWGVSEVENLKSPQQVFNKLVSFSLDVLALMGNPIWLNPFDSGVEDDQLENRTGLVIPHNREAPPQRIEGVNLQPWVSQFIDKFADWFNQVGGSQDITRGVNPTGVTAASAISSLQDAAQTRVRQKSRNLDLYLQQVGQCYAQLVMQHYSAPRVFRLTGKDGAQTYFKAHISKAQDGTTMLVRETFSPEGLSTGIQEYALRGKLDVRVSTGSSLPFNKAEKRSQTLELFDRGLIDQEEALKHVDWPNYEAVLQRMQAAAAQAQAAEAEAAAMKAGGSGAAPAPSAPPPPAA